MNTQNTEVFKPSPALDGLIKDKLVELHTDSDESDFSNTGDVVEVVGEPVETSKVTNLPKGVGIVDYSKVTFKQGDLLEIESLRASGVNVLDLTIPTKVREASLDANGQQKVSKAGKPVFKSLNLNYPAYLRLDKTAADWLMNNAASAICELMLHSVYDYLSKKNVKPVPGMIWTPEMLSKHFGTEDLVTAIAHIVNPWKSTNLTIAQREDLLCLVNLDGVPTKLRLQSALNAYADAYRRAYKLKHGRQPTASVINAETAPLTKLIAKYEAHDVKVSKCEAEGKPAPKWKLPLLTNVTPELCNNVVLQLNTLASEREKRVDAINMGAKPANATPEQIAAYVAATPEAVKNLRGAACVLDAAAKKLEEKQAANKTESLDMSFDLF